MKVYKIKLFIGWGSLMPPGSLIDANGNSFRNPWAFMFNF